MNEEVRAPFFPIFPLGVAGVRKGHGSRKDWFRTGRTAFMPSTVWVINDYRKGVEIIRENKGKSVELEIHRKDEVINKTAQSLIRPATLVSASWNTPF